MKKTKVPLYGRIRALKSGKNVYEIIKENKKRIIFSPNKKHVMKNFPSRTGWSIKQISKLRGLIGR